MERILFFLFTLVSLASQAQQSVRIAFGSCSRQDTDEQLWAEIVDTKPDIWIWGGDNIYGDSQKPSVLAGKYALQKNRKSYQDLLKTCPITGTWDDHDYGRNDGGKHFSIKTESKKLAAEFLGFPKDHPVWTHEGLYNSTYFNKNNKTIAIINLDTRYFRDTVYRELYTDTLTKKRVSHYLPNIDGDVLGEAQWAWLEAELKNSTANLHIINSSIQVLSEEHRFEKWKNLPIAHQRLLNLLKKYPSKKVIIISGDRHIAELSKRYVEELPYTLYDFTSSGLTHTWSEVWEENNRYREGNLIIEKNFGLIDITFTESQIQVTFSVVGKRGTVFQKIEASL